MDRDAFVATGHQIITDGLANAHRVADQHPNLPLKSLALSVEHTMRAFFNHLMDATDTLDGTPEPTMATLAAGIDASLVEAGDGAQLAADKAADAELAASAKAADEALVTAIVKDPTLKVQG